MKPVRAVAVLPTLFTLGNLMCGFFAIVVASRIDARDMSNFVPAPKLETARQLFDSTDPTHNLMFCGALIFAAMIFDTFDGQLARFTRTTSDFGGQLDSLCDVVSFGVAPAFLLVKMCPQFTSVHREAVWTIAGLFVCCVALRLARFNVETDEGDDHFSFVGLPSPAAAALIASAGMFSYTLRNEINFEKVIFTTYDYWLQRLMPPFAVLLALLMVSRVAYPHIVTQLLRRKRTFPHMVAIVFLIMTLWTARSFSVPIVCFLYIAYPLWHYAWLAFRHVKKLAPTHPGKTV
jgi:CDP-diacylglycerol---serine O-phosphatidyltransferase